MMTEESLQATPKHKFRFFVRGVRGQKTAKVFMSIDPANGESANKPVVLWRNATFRVRGKDRAAGRSKTACGPCSTKRPFSGSRSARVLMAVRSTRRISRRRAPFHFEVALPEGAFAGELQVDAELVSAASGTVLRCVLSDTEDVSKGRPSWALLGDPKSPGFQTWKEGVLEFASVLPLNSQGEAAPSDKDPIPEPFNNVYNQPERDHFHTKAKYYRTDSFLVEHILDDATRTKSGSGVE